MDFLRVLKNEKNSTKKSRKKGKDKSTGEPEVEGVISGQTE